MFSKSERKKFLYLYEKYFKEPLHISLENDINFNEKLIENISAIYKNKRDQYNNNSDNNFIVKEKMSLKAELELLSNSKSEFKYTSYLITTPLTILTFGIGITFPAHFNNIYKIADNKMKSLGDKVDYNKINSILGNYNLEMADLIKRFVLLLIIFIPVSFGLIQFIEQRIKKSEIIKISFYNLCYETLCKIEEGIF